MQPMLKRGVSYKTKSGYKVPEAHFAVTMMFRGRIESREFYAKGDEWKGYYWNHFGECYIRPHIRGEVRVEYHDIEREWHDGDEVSPKKGPKPIDAMLLSSPTHEATWEKRNGKRVWVMGKRIGGFDWGL